MKFIVVNNLIKDNTIAEQILENTICPDSLDGN